MNKAYLSQIATRLFDTPLAIHPAKLDVIFAVLAERLNLDLIIGHLMVPLIF